MTSLSFILLGSVGLSGCASAPPSQRHLSQAVIPTQTRESMQTAPQRGLAIARSLIGAPYRYGGADPRGFDCSGLVYYAFRKAGMEIPRTTSGQYRRSRRVAMSRLRPGDLLFFTISRDKPSHVGIYAGDGAFIHAPSSGKSVGYASLDDDYWRTRLIGSGRL
jgi:cell wall-associated NlpC family hydrolase